MNGLAITFEIEHFFVFPHSELHNSMLGYLNYCIVRSLEIATAYISVLWLLLCHFMYYVSSIFSFYEFISIFGIEVVLFQ